ncbi:hypothetical protein TI39_contig4195g00016 [Zymoseptoria brevis]|uniref:Uncharacterized protein n=1 Tax=Zymoseptoria brevis TaxID=1047168 RepID=A0A0F4GE20_9PEZI|nr:hypothetical protein TI39_contig4195g00016 [Zymoseptoria brevis]
MAKELFASRRLVFPCEYYKHAYDQAVRAASPILLGVFDAKLELDALVLGGVNYRLVKQQPHTLEQIGQVLKHVKHFQWDVGDTFAQESDGRSLEDYGPDEVISGPGVNETGFDEMHTLFDEGYFVDFLSGAESLQTLVIHLPDIEDSQLMPVELSDVVGGIVFPALESFSITRVTANGNGLKNFLACHKETLTQLRFCDLHMRPGPSIIGSWPRWFLRMKGTLPHLQKVCLRGGGRRGNGMNYVFGWSMSEYVGTRLSRAMEAFMINGGGALPQQSGVDHSDAFAQMSREQLLDWSGEAIVPKIKPIGWDISWEE